MMRDFGYRCHHCGSIQEVEAIRHNLFVDAHTIASYEAAPCRGIRRWLLYRRIARELLRALWTAE